MSHKLTMEEYLELDKNSEERYDYFDVLLESLNVSLLLSEVYERVKFSTSA